MVSTKLVLAAGGGTLVFTVSVAAFVAFVPEWKKIDFDECSDDTNYCHKPWGNCSNNAEGFMCTCVGGFTGNGIVCTDIDECLDTNTYCLPPLTNCTNTVGSFVCDCGTGYSSHNTTCSDIDECSGGFDTCDEDHGICTNTNGSYICSCSAGYSGDGNNCTDIDECVTLQQPCPAPFRGCANVEGSYKCLCPSGFEGYFPNCTDINECTNGEDICNADTAGCVNTDGSYACFCNLGFSGNGINCTEVDECSTGQHYCNATAGEVCKNNYPGFTCECQPGYQYNGLILQCEAPNSSHLVSDSCSTSSSTKETADHTNIDECSLGSHDCYASIGICNNTVGGFECSCPTGFVGDGINCTEVETKCQAGQLICHATLAICVETADNYTCLCLPGFTGDGVNCTDLDECGTVVESRSSHTVIGMSGGQAEVTCSAYDFSCQETTVTRIGVSNCTDEGGACTNTYGGFTCSCNAGYTGDGFVCYKLIDSCEDTDGVGIFLLSSSETLVYCVDKWVLFQLRDGSIPDFHNKSFEEYKNGFGTLGREFWWGLENLYQLGVGKTCALRVDLWSFGDDTAHQEYNLMSVGNEMSSYKIMMEGGTSGTAGDSLKSSTSPLKNIHGAIFSNDAWDGSSCTGGNSGGWWHADCNLGSPNAIYGATTDTMEAVIWYTWKGMEALKTTMIKVKCTVAQPPP